MKSETGHDYVGRKEIGEAPQSMTQGEFEPMLRFFSFEHLPCRLVHISRPFSELAHQMVANLPRNPERTAGLRKLLEAKDCAVRAML